MKTTLPVLLGLLLLGGCGNKRAAKPAEDAAKCQKAGQQCRLPKGPLGVCLPDNKGGYECTPQH